MDSNASITNMVLGGVQTGVFYIAGGTTTIGQQSQSTQYTDTIGSSFIIGSQAILIDLSYNPLQFSNNNLTIQVIGLMKVSYGTGNGSILIDNAKHSNDYIDVNNGILLYLGKGGITDTFNVPVYIRKGGTFDVAEYTGPTQGGTLVVKDLSGYKFPNGSLESVYMKDANSSVQLTQQLTLECDYDYYQAGGTLETMDSNPCTLQDGPTGNLGTATIAGGNLKIAAQSTSAYGTLNITGNLSFGGMYFVAIAGNSGNPGQSDKLNVTGTTTLQNTSALTVYVNGQTVVGEYWIIIKDNPGNNIQLPAPKFTMPITSIPQTALNGGVYLNDQTQYRLSS